MLEGTALYFHIPTHILHGLIMLEAGEKVKKFSDPLVYQTVWFCLCFHRILSILLLLTRPFRQSRDIQPWDFCHSFDPNSGLPGYSRTG